MGIWGPKLYEDDIAEDIRNFYTKRLSEGKTGDEATALLLQEYSEELSDSDDAPVIWFALADTQWNVGRLQDDVRDKALWHIEEGSDLRRWQEGAPEYYKRRKTTLEKLKTKLLSPQPPEKRISLKEYYHCPWKLGDVFAYQISGRYAEEKQIKGKYLFFVKVGEDIWNNECVIPIVYVYWVISDDILSIEELERIGYIPQFTLPKVYVNTRTRPEKYRLSLITTSSRVIPKKKLTYVGNIDLSVPFEEPSPFSTYRSWRVFEKYIIDNFQNWEGYQYLTKR